MAKISKTIKKDFTLYQETISQLDKMKSISGASRSASVRIAVDQYFKRIMKDKEGGV